MYIKSGLDKDFWFFLSFFLPFFFPFFVTSGEMPYSRSVGRWLLLSLSIAVDDLFSSDISSSGYFRNAVEKEATAATAAAAAALYRVENKRDRNWRANPRVPKEPRKRERERERAIATVCRRLVLLLSERAVAPLIISFMDIIKKYH